MCLNKHKVRKKNKKNIIRNKLETVFILVLSESNSSIDSE